jgi:NAD(P)-dependent dehydrogenase (short-subunit alcohol dehydrogenase family)
MKLENQVAFITGAASGIGRATSVLFASEGAKVTVADIDSVMGGETVSIIKKSGGEARFVEVDVTDAVSLEKAIKGAAESSGRLDILFNNAGIGSTTAPLEDVDETDWDIVLGVNLKGTYLGCKYAIPIMKKQRSGNIISTSSESGINAMPNRVAYGVSKAAIIHLTKSLSMELASFNIRVNCICPGPILTPIFGKVDVRKLTREMAKKTPLARMGQPEEIAQAALFLVSNDAAYITGHALIVDGGITAR